MKDIDIKINFSQLEKDLKDISKELKGYTGVRAGFYQEEKEKDSDLTVAEVALANEFGTMGENGIRIPPRPFIRNTLKKEEIWRRIFSQLCKKKNSLGLILRQIGHVMRNDMIKSIDSNIPPPNSEKTIKKKGSSHTLIDTGTMRNSIHIGLIKDKNDTDN